MTVSACVPPMASVADDGDTVMDDSVFAAGVVELSHAESRTLPQAASAKAKRGTNEVNRIQRLQ